MKNFSGLILVDVSSKRQSHILGRDVLENSRQSFQTKKKKLLIRGEEKQISTIMLDGTQYGGLASVDGPKSRKYPAVTRT